ncbi:MAG: hypothetical protein V1869_05165 [Candidatus Omnitrophota bacterium]
MKGILKARFTCALIEDTRIYRGRLFKAVAKFEQKAVARPLLLLYLNIQGIYIVSTPPAFIFRNISSVIRKKLYLKSIGALDGHEKGVLCK